MRSAAEQQRLRTPPDITNYQSTYGQMSDEQLLHMASERESLCAEARLALHVELAKRGLDEGDIDRYVDSVRIGQLEDEQQKPLAQTFNGFGTHLYGKRRFGADGSYITTLWVVFFWIPVVPLKSVHVIEAGPGTSTLSPGWSTSYRVLHKSRPDARQVVNVYAFMALLFIGAALLDLVHAGESLALVALGMWACLPWLLRRTQRKLT